MSDYYDVSKVKDFPAALKFNNALLGATDGPISVSRKVEYNELTCNQTQGATIEKRIKSIVYTIKAKLLEVDKATMILLGATKKVTAGEIGKNVFATAAALEAAEIGGTDTHKWPEVIAELDYEYELDGEKFHGIEVTFTTIPVPLGGLYYEVTTGGAA